MTNHWHQFLLSRQARFDRDGIVSFPSEQNNCGKSIHPLTHFGVLTLSGPDAAKLLQGQITCNINDIVESQSSLAAMCNPKGRVFSTFIIVKQSNQFLLVLPIELVELLRQKLQMYVLRSDVKIVNRSDELGVVGVTGQPQITEALFFTEQQHSVTRVFLPGSFKRSLWVLANEEAAQLWSQLTEHEHYQAGGSAQWQYMDIVSGLPWLTLATSEAFIPQMLNLDKLGGISFSKGCYTGQEIVARTHYLGKVKREMLLADCAVNATPAPHSIIVAGNDTALAIGHVLQAQRHANGCKLQVILHTNDVGHDGLWLKDYNQPLLNLARFHYD